MSKQIYMYGQRCILRGLLFIFGFPLSYVFHIMHVHCKYVLICRARGYKLHFISSTGIYVILNFTMLFVAKYPA